MKKTWSVLLGLLLLVVPAELQAQFSFTTNADNTLTLSAYAGSGGVVVIPANFDGLTVTAIGTNVFSGSKVEEVTVPNTVLNIGNLAFSGCFDLTNVNLSDAVTNLGSGAFGFCFDLTSVTIPSSVTTIGNLAFIFCTNLASVSIPSGVGTIGQAAFQDCLGMTNLTISPGVTNIQGQAFLDCPELESVIIPGTVTSLGSDVFDNCTGLGSAVLEPGITGVAMGMFLSCSSLTNVSIPAGVTNIGDYAFAVTGLTNVTLPGGLQGIGQGAFSQSSLDSATVPASVTDIGVDAWTFCGNLTNITVDSPNSFYSSLNGVLFDASQATLIQFPGGLTGTYSLPGSATDIAEDAFAGSGVTTVIFGPGVTNIGFTAFYDSSNLTSLDFQGNAPVTDSTAFSADTNATIYYVQGTTGWTSPFAGLPAVLAEFVTWANPASIGYGTALTTNQLNATANVPGSFTYNPDIGSVLNAGTNVISVVFTPSDTTFFVSLTNTVTLVVSPAPLTITANSTTKSYGSNLTFAGTEFASGGLVNGDMITNVILTSAGAAASATVSGSPYAIVPSAAQPASVANNYNITYADGELTVSPVVLAVTANSTNKSYGTTITFAGTEFTARGLVNGDTVTSVTLTSAGAAPTASAAGSPYPIVPSAAQPSSLAANYIIVYNDGLLTVSPVFLAITANNTNKPYGTTITFAGTEFTASGLMNGDTVSSVTLTSAGTAASAPVSGSPYNIVPGAALPSSLTNNYVIIYDDGALTVSPALLTITANSTNKIYGATLTFAGTEFTANGLVNGDTVTSATLTSAGAAATATVSGSPYPIVPSAALPPSLATNYSIVYSNGLLTVSPAPLSITAKNANKPYGATVTFAGTEFTAGGLLNGDVISSVTLTSAGAAASATVSGSPYAIVPSGAQPSSVASNYNIGYNNGQLTVTAAGVTIASGITANNKYYDGTTNATLSSNNVTFSGVLAGDTVSLDTNGYTATFASSGVGSNIAVSVSGLTLTGASAGNYSLTQPTGLTADITAPHLLIEVSKPNLILSWPTNAAYFALNQAAALGRPPVWSPVTNSITVAGTNNTVTLSATGQVKFFELIAP